MLHPFHISSLKSYYSYFFNSKQSMIDDLVYKRNCIILAYPVDGAWSFWGTWGTCSVTCDNGTRTRTRTCDNPAPTYGGDQCQGPSQDISECLMNTCPGILFFVVLV